jgi:hypothetical protein
MEITSFEAADDFMVTLHMSGMPQEASRTNTTVYIAGAPQGTPAIYFSEQRIVFKANTNAEKGRISVFIGDVTAESTTDYTPPAEEPEGEQPVVNSISQTTAYPGARRTLRGEKLGKVNGVALFTGDFSRLLLGPRFRAGLSGESKPVARR